jgi:hypothetical protein
MARAPAPERATIPPVDRDRICAACRWSRIAGRFEGFITGQPAQCLHPLVSNTESVNPVTGERIQPTGRPCWEVRHFPAQCGPDGKLWEAKDA